MKIYYISHSQIPSQYANSIHVMKMCQGFAKSGHEVILFAKKGGSDTADDFKYYGIAECFRIIKHIFSSDNLFSKVQYLRAVKKDIKNLPNPDIFYSRHPYCSFAIPPKINVPIIFEAHSIPRDSIEKLVLKTLLKKKTFKKLVVISHALKDLYIKIYPFLSEKNITIAPDGADSISTNTQPLRYAGARESALQIGYVGSLWPGRGIDNIVALAQRLVDMDFHVWGGSEREVSHWKEKCSLITNLHFHGYVNPSLCDSIRLGMDVLLAPYQKTVYVLNNKNKTENTVAWMSPMKVFEYMAAGKAIIGSDLPAMREILENNVNALLIDPENIDSWEISINHLRNSELREKLGKNAREKLINLFTWKSRAISVLE